MSSLRKKFEQARDRAKALKDKAERTEAEDAELIQMLDRAEALKVELEEAEEVDSRIEALGEVSRALAIPGTLLSAKSEPEPLTVGEYVAAAMAFGQGTMSADEFVDRAAAYHDDADTLTDRVIIDRALNVVADVVGVVPSPIVGPLIDIYDTRRRVWSSFTQRSMPLGSGKTFERPKTTQHVDVAEQMTEGADLVQQEMEIDSDTVTKRTFGGAGLLSRQVQDWTTPEMLGLVVEDLFRVYARKSEAAAVTHLLGLATAEELWDPTNTASVVASFVGGYEAVATSLDDDVPITIWLSTDAAVAMTVPTGATDRTTWEVVREAMSALDTNVSWVVSRRLPANTRIVGAGQLVEAYEQKHGLLTLQRPTNLTTELSVSAYVAFHGIAAGFVSLAAA